MDSVITGEQIRAARALLRINQRELADAAMLSVETIKRLENIRGEIDANLRTVKSIRSAFYRLGAVFEAYTGLDAVVGLRSRDARDGPARPRRPGEHHASVLSGGEREGSRDAEPALHRLIYFSTALVAGEGRTGAAELARLRDASNIRNARQNVTGALLLCGRFFIQVLEGSQESVGEVYASISRDRRHDAVTLLQSKATPYRLFTGWTMPVGTLSHLDEIIVDDLAMTEGFDPRRLTPASALGLLVLVAVSPETVMARQHHR